MDSKKEINRQVLFQKINNRWYVFTEGEDDTLFTALPEGMDPREKKLELYEILETHLAKSKEAQSSNSQSAADKAPRKKAFESPAMS